MNLKETYNRIADDWHRDHQSDTWWVESTDHFISLLKPGDSVLDVGCGGGTKAKYLTAKGLRVTGIDFAERMIEIAKQEVPAGAFFAIDLRKLPKLPYTFDGVFAQATLLHIPKKEILKVLQILKQKLKPGGYLYVAVKEARPGQPEEEMMVEEDYGYRYERLFSYFTLPELERYLGDVRIAVCYCAVTPSGNSRWIQIIGQGKMDNDE